MIANYKGTRIPYIGHLLVVISLKIENGGEDKAIAALLYNAVRLHVKSSQNNFCEADH